MSNKQKKALAIVSNSILEIGAFFLGWVSHSLWVALIAVAIVAVKAAVKACLE